MKELKAGNKYWVQYNKMRPFPYFVCCSKTIGHKKIDFFFQSVVALLHQLFSMIKK